MQRRIRLPLRVLIAVLGIGVATATYAAHQAGAGIRGYYFHVYTDVVAPEEVLAVAVALWLCFVAATGRWLLFAWHRSS